MDLDSMYAAYNLEYENVHTVSIPETGFINYKVENRTPNTFEIYIKEMYVIPAKRGKKNAAKLADLCILHAEKEFDQKLTKLYGSIGMGCSDGTSSLKAMLSYGFKVYMTTNEMLYLYKEL